MSARRIEIHIAEVIVRGHRHASPARIEAEVRAGIVRALAGGALPPGLSTSAPLLRSQPGGHELAADLGAAIVRAQPVGGRS